MENNRYVEDFDFQSKVQSALAGELGEKEQNSLFDILSNDKTAEEEFFFSRSLAKTLKNQDMFAVTGIIGQIIQEEGLPEPDDQEPEGDAGQTQTPPQYSAPKTAVSSVKTWLIGSAVALLVSAGIYTMTQKSTTLSAEQASMLTRIVKENIEFLDDRAGTETPLPGLEDYDNGMKAYNSEDYETAAELLGKYYRRTNDEIAGLYLANALIMTNAPRNQVEELFSKVRQKLSNAVRYDAEWCYIMAKIKWGEIDEARSLIYMVKSESPHHKKAENLLIELSKFSKVRDN